MSLTDFWLNFRTGVRLLAPKVTADSPKVDAADIQERLRKTDLWLSPSTVADFSLADFDFLSDEEQARLNSAVTEFRQVALGVPPRAPATEEQVNAALPAFLEIVDILRPDRYSDLEALILGKKIERVLKNSIPRFVSELRFETGTDSNDTPALWIWVILKDESISKAQIISNTRQIRALLEAATRKVGGSHWPYVRFRTESDLLPEEELRAGA